MTSGVELLQFFALFYTSTQIATFALQAAVTPVLTRFGLGRTISSLPAGVGLSSAIALLFPVFPTFLFARATEFVLRGSLFRSAYELVFAPMVPDEKRRTKTFLDVACDRAGDGPPEAPLVARGGLPLSRARHRLAHELGRIG